MSNDTTPTRIIYPTKAERVTARVAPAPWDVLTAEDARYYAGLLEKDGRIGSAWRLRAYADAVDAMTQPTRIEYETEEA
ncbi:MAG: hypothetical protein KDI12_20295 [Anaerolineae bacterium]|nr:hypothetical protein [Anaerolineae bacterium]